LFFNAPLEVDPEFQQMIVAPHGGFAAGGFTGLRLVIPSVGLVVEAVRHKDIGNDPDTA
jgi:hypothetical protein